LASSAPTPTEATKISPSDLAHMRAALGLAARGLGRTWPNPAVGCVLVHEDGGSERVVGRGWTQPGGRPHAETEALARAGEAARGATAYVTLEPCAHTGKTPPCADALIAAGIGRAVVAVEDPDPRVSGRGLARLREAGIRVDLGVGATEAHELNAGFFLRVREGRPLVSLKLATSLDGRIATQGGESKWITGEAARRRAHLLRAQHDAVMVGTGTAKADDPELTSRLPGLMDRSPVRVVPDRLLVLPNTAKIFKTAALPPTWIVTGPELEPPAPAPVPPELARLAERTGAVVKPVTVDMIRVSVDDGGRLSLPETLRALGGRGITRLLVEGGGTLAAGFLRAGLVDRIYWFRAALLIGGEGLPAVAPLGVAQLKNAARFERLDVMPLGDDILETYRRVP
jgi:diaminohydroxyphosphoribosylaminopyrimidine deaminase / 5-amino-6-(5-phosphoribosylamino)uracil reductase